MTNNRPGNIPRTDQHYHTWFFGYVGDAALNRINLLTDNETTALVKLVSDGLSEDPDTADKHVYLYPAELVSCNIQI